MRTVVDMSGHAPRLDERSFRFLIIGAGLCWSVAFVVIALFYELELYGDGAMFSTLSPFATSGPSTGTTFLDERPSSC